MNKFYDILAPDYKKILNKKKKYISSINKIVIKVLKNKKYILDIGTGDGSRLEKIKSSLKKSYFFAVEPSKEMCRYFKKNSKIKLFKLNVLNLDKIKIKNFDGIMCLWNVFGHLNSNKQRILALKKIADKMHDSSILILDVNNRYNAKAYGYFNVFCRFFIDYFFFHEKRGNTSYILNVKKKKIRGTGHIFTDDEFSNNLKKAGLKIVEKKIINYEDGKIMKNLIHGQLLYIAMLKNKI